MQIRPATTIESRHPADCEKPTARKPAKTSGITACVTPPPRLPQPAVVALAVPTQFGANITDVWYCVITNAEPIKPISNRNTMNDSKFHDSPTAITGSEPATSNAEYVN